MATKSSVALLYEQGAGKTLLSQAIGTALSRRYHCTRVDLKASSNVNWRGYACKEWPEFHRDMDEEWLKDLITSETYFVNAKYGGQWTEDNFTLNIFTCNGLKSKLQPGDKRFVVGGYAKGDDQRLGLEFEKWVRGPGPNYLRYHLLNDISTVEYETLNVATEMQAEVISASKSKYEYIADLIIEHLEEIDGLECVPNPILVPIIEQYNVDPIHFLRAVPNIFVKPRRDNVDINGKSTKFKAFKNHERWKNEVNSDEYRKQSLLAAKLTPDRKF
jgi:hypothetical protein